MRRKPPQYGFWRGRKSTALLLATLLVAFTAACNGPKAPDPDPDPNPIRPTLSATPTDLQGVTRSLLSVGAKGDWQLSVGPPNSSIATAVTLTPASGHGNATVVLRVDPTGLEARDHSFEVLLNAGGLEVKQRFTLSFPSVTGRAVVIDPLSLAGEPVDIIPSAPIGVAPQGASDVVPVRPDGSMTLIVGLEAADAQLRQQGAAGPASLSAQAALRNTVSALGSQAAVTDNFDSAGVVLVEVRADQADDAVALLNATPGVRYVELPVPLYSLSNDPHFDQQWNVHDLGVEALWPEADGSGVTIAIIDNGFYPDHPDLRGNIVGTYDAGEDKVDVTVTNPACGTHGTHVAGIAAAVTNNHIGVAGVAPGAKLLLVDIDDSREPGKCPMVSDTLIKALNYVVNDKGLPRAQVINMSVGRDNDLGRGVRDALTAADNAGIALVAAAGNNDDRCYTGGKTSKQVKYPAAYPMVLAVGATGRTGERACYSLIGNNLDLMAPGGDPFLTGAGGAEILSTDYDISSDRPIYGSQSGTSMAAPAVAGVIALLLDAKPTASADTVIAALTATATDLGTPGRDAETGYGLINPPAAYAELTRGPIPEPPIEPDTLWLRVDGYPDNALQADGFFTLRNASLGEMTIIVGTYDDNGVLGSPGELFGEETLKVAFDTTNVVEVLVKRVP